MSQALQKAVEHIERSFGILVPPHRRAALEAELARLGGKGGLPAGLNRLLAGGSRLAAELPATLTPPESYLFRHAGHFSALRRLATRRFERGRPCRVLCAGCSTGEEAWSAAAVLASVYMGAPDAYSVVGWDLDDRRIRQARQGRFRPWAVRRGLQGYGRYISRRRGGGYQVAESLKRSVSFATVNLVDEHFPTAGPLDAIFFRNVSIYWRAETANRVAERLAGLLAPDGLFLVGACDPCALPRSLWRQEIVESAVVFRRRGAPAATPALHAVPATTSPSRRERATHHRRRAGLRRVGAPAEAVPAARAGKADHGTLTDWLVVAQVHANRGEYEAALSLIREQEERLPPEALHLMGLVLLNLERVEEAVRMFRECVYWEPGNENYRRWLAAARRAGAGSEGLDPAAALSATG